MRKIWIWVLVGILVVGGAVTGVILGRVGQSKKAKNVPTTQEEYTVTFMVDGEAVGTATYSKDKTKITYPTVPAKSGYDGVWEDVTLTDGDVTINAIYTAIEYTITFMVDGQEVGVATYTVEDKQVTYPVVPEKPCYTGAWKQVELETGDVTIEVEYTLAGHTFGAWQEEIPATCTENGTKAYCHCSVCNKDFDQDGNEIADLVIPAGHNLEWNDQIDESCTENGTKAHYHCSVCGLDFDVTGNTIADITIPAHHTFGEWQDEIPAQNGENGTKGHYHCSVCQKDFDENGQEIDDLTIIFKIYTRVDETGEESETGSYILFGSYPQAEVTSSMKTLLSEYVAEKPDSGDDKDWTSYGYKSGAVNMWYKDVEFEGERYRAVYFTNYRPSNTNNGTEFDDSNQFYSGYIAGNVYWFKFEPIKWRIVKEDNGNVILLAEIILDAQEYNVSNYSGGVITDGKTIYKNNYEYSGLRAWLNDSFYNIAFSKLEQSKIVKTQVDNSARSSNPDNYPEAFNSGENSYACDGTSDYVWVPSMQEITTEDYGFDPEWYDLDGARRKEVSAYAKIQGASFTNNGNYKKCGLWWLRSPYANGANQAWWVSDEGNVTFGLVNWSSTGVVPAITLQIS